ncbi:MAG: ATP-binding protein [Candidatus Obscuribacter sp.]|nr:ATP-binding protein [Candidatus Obscuribacter sp.]
MLKHPTIEKLANMGLTGMIRALEMQSQLQEVHTLSFEDRLALLIDAEFSERDTSQFTKRLKAAKLRDNACIEDIDFKANRGIDKRLVAQLSGGQWIKDHRNVLITGKTGVGKTYLACALGQKACRLGHTVLYFRAPRFFQELTVARLKGNYQSTLARLKRTHLLILDDFALVPVTEEQCRDMLEVADDRSGAGSFIISSQLPVKDWYQTFANATLADAILDRVVHGSYRLDLSGPTRRDPEHGKKE